MRGNFLWTNGATQSGIHTMTRKKNQDNICISASLPQTLSDLISTKQINYIDPTRAAHIAPDPTQFQMLQGYTAVLINTYKTITVRTHYSGNTNPMGQLVQRPDASL